MLRVQKAVHTNPNYLYKKMIFAILNINTASTYVRIKYKLWLFLPSEFAMI